MLGGVKRLGLLCAMQTPIRQKPPNFIILYFLHEARLVTYEIQNGNNNTNNNTHVNTNTVIRYK